MEDIYKFYENCPYRIEVRKSVTSTNTIVKEMAENGEKAGFCLVAEHQSQGRGRLGRSFESPDRTGLYMSVLLRPEMKALEALFITTATAVAVARALEKLVPAEKSVKIKWVNDIYIDDLKVCGILTEASIDFRTGGLEYAVVGIGVNLYANKVLTEKLSGIAGVAFEDSREDLRAKLCAEILKELTLALDFSRKTEVIDYFRQKSYLDGKEVSVITPRGSYPAKVLGIDENAHLVVEKESGEKVVLSSDEVSVRKA